MNKIFSIVFFVICINAFGQNANEIYSNEMLVFSNEKDFESHQFLDSTFYQGKIYLNDGKYASALMNYNLFDNGISVIGKDKNALLLDGLDQILFVSYNSRVFFPYLGFFLEQIETFKNGTSLLIKRNAKTNRNIPAYGMTSVSESGGKNSSTIGIGNQTSLSDLNEESKIEVTMESEFYLKMNGKYHSLTRIKDLKKLFPNKKDSIVAYISDNHLDISKVSDLKQIIKYCSEDAK
jgi:hypothetical protein